MVIISKKEMASSIHTILVTSMASQMGKGLHAGFFCLKTWVFCEKPGFSVVNQVFLLKSWVFCEKLGFTLENPGLQQKTWVYIE